MVIRLLQLLRRLRRHRFTTLWALVAIVALALLGCALVFHFTEGRHRDPALSFGDAMWFSLVSITTVGYGDLYPTTALGRIGVAFFTVVIGLGSFTVLIGVLVDLVGTTMQKGRRGMLPIRSEGHVLLIHYPSDRRIRQIVSELTADKFSANRDIVLISDQIDELPTDLEGVQFVHGSALSPATLERANAGQAAIAIVLATAYTDPNSDAVVASAVTVAKSVNASIYTVAELMDEDKRSLFESARSDAVVPAHEITGNLLVQESQDHGVSKLVEMMTSNRFGATVFSGRLSESEDISDYREVARHLIEADVNFVAVLRGTDCLTSFGELKPQAEDQLLYIARQRIPADRFSRICLGQR